MKAQRELEFTNLSYNENLNSSIAFSNFFWKSGERMCRRKVYVTVNAEHKPDGSCLPKTIRMAGEEEYEIDRVLQVRRAASEVGGRGIRYTIRIGRSETYLFDEENGRWFVEAKFG